MTDRFKFRVWDEIFKTYRNFAYFVNASDGTLGEVDDKDIYSFRNDTYLKREQCTGLRDKNGNLIYEGDIIFINGEKWIVIWNDADCAFFFSNLKEEYHQPIFPDFYLWACDFKVIGNIHENKEFKE